MARAGDPVLTATDVFKHYGGTTALAGVTLDLHAGVSTALLGPSGSGKSTLLECLAGLTRPSDGEVHLDGHRIDRLSEQGATRLRRERFGFVSQSDPLLPDLSIIENVALPLIGSLGSRRWALKVARTWLESIGLRGLEQRRPGQLSDQQLRRVAIARAVVVSPAVIFADEPTAGLDHATGQETIAVLTAACRRANSALLLATDDPDVASACDRVVRMSNGVIDQARVVLRAAG